VPAAAVIPAPIAYTKVVAVKKLVDEIVSCGVGLPLGTTGTSVWLLAAGAPLPSSRAALDIVV